MSLFQLLLLLGIISILAGVFVCAAALLSRYRQQQTDRQFFMEPVRRLRR